MRTKYITDSRDMLGKLIDNKDGVTQEELWATLEEIYKNLKMTALFARNASSKGFLASTNMSEDQIKETAQYNRIVGLGPGEGCTLEITPDMYKYIRWVIKRDNPLVRLRTINLGNNLISVSRIA